MSLILWYTNDTKPDPEMLFHSENCKKAVHHKFNTITVQLIITSLLECTTLINIFQLCFYWKIETLFI